MSISLTPDQEAWLNAHVARGDFPSVADAVRQLINDRMAEEGDDLAWAKPSVDEAVAAVSRGEVITREAQPLFECIRQGDLDLHRHRKLRQVSRD